MPQPALTRSLGEIMAASFPTAHDVGFAVSLRGPGGADAAITHPGKLPVAAATSGPRFNLMCGFKPVAMLSAVAAVEQATRFDADDVPGWDAGGGASWRDALGHRAGLAYPDALTFISQSEPARSTTAQHVLARPVERTHTAFSEVAILIHLDRLAAMYATPPLPQCVEDLAAELGLPSTFCFSNRAPVREIGCLLDTDVASGTALPFLHDRLPHFYGHRTTTYFGGYSTAQEMSAFYRSVADCLMTGQSLPGLPSGATVKSLFGRSDSGASPTPYEGGCMRLSSHGITGLGDGAFGHIGFMRTSLGFFDPDSGLAGFAIVRDAGYTGLQARLEGWQTFILEVRHAGLTG